MEPGVLECPPGPRAGCVSVCLSVNVCRRPTWRRSAAPTVLTNQTLSASDTGTRTLDFLHTHTHTHTHTQSATSFFFSFSWLSKILPSVLWRCWLGDRKGIPPVKTEWWGAGVWSEVQTCIYCPADAIATHSLSLASVKSRLVLPFWYQLTLVVPEKGPLNGCVCACVCVVEQGPETTLWRQLEKNWNRNNTEITRETDLSLVWAWSGGVQGRACYCAGRDSQCWSPSGRCRTTKRWSRSRYNATDHKPWTHQPTNSTA